MGPVDLHKRELCKQAYLLIHKYLAAADKEGQESFEFRKNLRRKDALDIDLATNKEVMSELNKFKEQGGVAALVTGHGSVQGSAANAGVKAARSKGAGAAGMGTGGAAGLPPLGAGGAKGGAKPSRSTPKGGVIKAEGGPSLASLPPKIGFRINRWWPNENKWYTAVVTDFNAETNEYRLTYNLGSAQETYEDLNMDVADPSVYEITGDKLNLLAQKGSAAVNNSTVLQPFLARAGGTKSSKKRRSSDDDMGSDEDYQ
ncbi:hypothetical protein TSOC_008541 [Tetrabaena socialis]|uniref:Tudor domain-containing protein n=1 Tax=Tetrabaena socialis TaxID=47790 RepID=A0A2J7ZY80_9CHLO|nr:hypothetical protein TSOC_008541 [Tetrabaena socialis]|eukprot:PNH05216.1 hypothetical protein TSOC_008541 [Tetrabaena socialis]